MAKISGRCRICRPSLQSLGIAGSDPAGKSSRRQDRTGDEYERLSVTTTQRTITNHCAQCGKMRSKRTAATTERPAPIWPGCAFAGSKLSADRISIGNSVARAGNTLKSQPGWLSSCHRSARAQGSLQRPRTARPRTGAGACIGRFALGSSKTVRRRMSWCARCSKRLRGSLCSRQNPCSSAFTALSNVHEFSDQSRITAPPGRSVTPPFRVASGACSGPSAGPAPLIEIPPAPMPSKLVRS